MKTCTTCKKPKEEGEFAWQVRNIRRKAVCRQCGSEYNARLYAKSGPSRQTERNRERRAANRAFLRKYLEEHPCVHCGMDDIEVLQFDHIDPRKKTKAVSTMLLHGKKSIEAELAKCQVLCANCHVKKTRRQFGWWVANEQPQI